MFERMSIPDYYQPFVLHPATLSFEELKTA